MGRLIRVDAELVRRNLAPSRQHAREMIAAGRVLLGGEAVRKAARQMDPAQPLLVVESEREDYVSRGAWKLIGALDLLGEDGPAVEGVRCLDAGASTGGFTDVLLRRGTSSPSTSATGRSLGDCGRTRESPSSKGRMCAPWIPRWSPPRRASSSATCRSYRSRSSFRRS